MTDIIQKNHKILRTVAVEVKISDIKNKDIIKDISIMKEALLKEEDGVAIAAPQVGISKRIFVVSKKILPDMSEDKVYINPKIIFSSKDRKKMSEGCLSVRWLYGKVKRSSRVIIEALNEKGEKIKETGTGIIAQIFQHEIDHLNGILFIDKAEDLKEIPPDKEKENKNERS